MLKHYFIAITAFYVMLLILRMIDQTLVLRRIIAVRIIYKMVYKSITI